MKRLFLAVILLMLSTQVWAAPDADHDADRAASDFSAVTPAADDYWILTDTSNSGRFAKVLTSNVRASLGLGTSDNPSFNSVHASGGNLAAANAQVTKKWITGLQYTADVTSVIHGGHHFICTSTHTSSAAGATGDEPGVGDTWATKWKYAGEVIDASGFNGNLATTDDTLQEVAQKLDDLVAGGDDLGSAAYSDVTALWASGSCSGYLKSDGTCDTPTGGYTNLTSFLTQTAWRIFYSDGSGDVKELALGADGEYLKSNGASAAPSWATPSGAAHDAVTLGADADVLLGLSTQQLTLDSQTANYFLAAPNGSAGDPTFRAIVAADIPTLNQNTTGTAGGLSGTPNITVGTVTASEYLTSAVDGNRWAGAANTVAITADATLGRIAWLTDRWWLANGTNWTTRYLLDSSFVDDTPVNGATADPVSSNWAYDHEAASDPHTGYVLESGIGSTVQAYDADITVDAIEYVIDGGGSAITTGVKGFLEVPYAATINRATVLCDQSGSIVIDVWKDTYANYPPTDADSITASAVPTVSTATKAQDATLTGWTTSVTAGDIIGFNVDSATTVTRCTISLKVAK